MQHKSHLAKGGNSSLYQTSNQIYGTSTYCFRLEWSLEGAQTDRSNIKTAKVPTFSEIMNSMNDFKKAGRLVKNKVVREKMDAQNIKANAEVKKIKEFPIKKSEAFKYPESGLKVGPSLYQTSNMAYGNLFE